MWPWVVGGVVLFIVVLGGVAVVGAGWLVSSLREPVDVANTYLDDARAGVRPAASCPDAFAPGPDLAASTGQDLVEVDVRNNRVAEVGGELFLGDGTQARVTVDLENVDGWCVTAVRVDGR